jgi:CheY-like chemotaxis protein
VRPHGAAGAGRLTDVHVLVVDDNEDAREAIAIVLEDAGATVSQADSVAEAMLILSSTPLSLILSDVAMPGRDGYELMRLVRAPGGAPSLQALPALALTAYAGPDDRSKALAAGFQEHLAKPVDPNDLVRVIAALARREASHLSQT